MNNRRSVYLDYSATTPLDPRVLDKMLLYFTEDFGNTTSGHAYGRRAEDAVETARETVAEILHCTPAEVIFTGGGSESDNLAIRGVAWSQYETERRDHLITTPVEHSAVTRTIQQLGHHGTFRQTVLPVDQQGVVDPEMLSETITPQTSLVSIIYANNEIGTINNVPALAEVAHQRNSLLHTDAVQAAGQLSLNVNELGVDLMSLSGHKFYGPKGVGVLYCRDEITLESHLTGGSHESGRRAGTLNTPGIVGFAEALRLAYSEQGERITHLGMLRDALIDGILSRVPDTRLTGHATLRLPSHASFVFGDVDSSRLLMHLDLKGIAASAGSACKTGNPEPSSVLLAMGYSPESAIGGLRLTVGKDTTIEEIEYAIDGVADAVEKVRKLNKKVVM